MLTVKTVFDPLWLINLIEDPISILKRYEKGKVSQLYKSVRYLHLA